MYVSGKGAVVVQEEHGFPHKIKVLISKDLGKDELLVVWDWKISRLSTSSTEISPRPSQGLEGSRPEAQAGAMRDTIS